MTAQEMIEAYFDRELPPEREMELARRLHRDAKAAKEFAQVEAVAKALRAPVQTPYRTAEILAEIGRRRGWLGSRLQRFVSVGRVAMAASFLLILGGALAARRFSPDSAIFPTSPTPLADVTDSASEDANHCVYGFLTTIDKMGSATRFISASSPSRFGPQARGVALTAGLPARHHLPAGAASNADCETRTFSILLTSRNNGSLKQLTDQQRMGYVVYIAKQRPGRRGDDGGKESSVGGW